MNNITPKEDFRDWIIDNWTTAVEEDITKSITKHSKKILLNGKHFDISNVVDRNDLVNVISDNLKTGLLNVVDTYNDASSVDSLTQKIEDWATEKELHLSKPSKQFLKVIEEIGELAEGMAKNRQEQIKDSLGDVYVTLVILAMQLDLDIVECLSSLLIMR